MATVMLDRKQNYREAMRKMHRLSRIFRAFPGFVPENRRSRCHQCTCRLYRHRVAVIIGPSSWGKSTDMLGRWIYYYCRACAAAIPRPTVTPAATLPEAGCPCTS